MMTVCKVIQILKDGNQRNVSGVHSVNTREDINVILNEGHTLSTPEEYILLRTMYANN